MLTNKNILITLIDKTLSDLENFNKNFYISEVEPKTKIILSTLKAELLNNPFEINERVLRGMKDVGIYSYKAFEASPLESSIINLNNELHNQIHIFRDLKPLGLNFGKEFPF